MQTRADIRIVHINEDNREKYKTQVSEWLTSDFFAKGYPRKHFYHNLDTIRECFDQNQAVIAVTKEDEAIGYCIWNQQENTPIVYLNIVEVQKQYRRQGILRSMLAFFSNSHPDVCLMCASSLSEDGRRALTKLGWKPSELSRRTEYYVKPLKTNLQAVDESPKQGPVIALHHTKEEHGGPTVKTTYYPIEFDASGQLTTPIITPFYYDGYCSVYLDQKLIIKNTRVKHLFVQRAVHQGLHYLTLTNIMPKDRAPFDAVGFFEEKTHAHKNEDTQADSTACFESPLSRPKKAKLSESEPSRKRSDYSVLEAVGADPEEQAKQSRQANADGPGESKRSCQ